jgi:hypothetical protein
VKYIHRECVMTISVADRHKLPHNVCWMMQPCYSNTNNMHMNNMCDGLHLLSHLAVSCTGECSSLLAMDHDVTRQAS